MTALPFRFAAQAAPQDADQWLGLARRAKALGYSSLLMPDGMQLLSPLPALALAAGATTTLRVGTWVLASPLRPGRGSVTGTRRAGGGTRDGPAPRR